MTCKNCHTEVQSRFCPACGQPTSLKRIDGKYILHEIEHVLHVERGIFFTIRALALHPGQSIREYLSENRSRLVKPVIFIIVTSLIYTLLNQFFHMEDGFVVYDETNPENPSAAGGIVKWIKSHYGYANIMMGVFVALWLKLFFKKEELNFFEILVMLCFVQGMAFLIFSLFILISGITHLGIMKVAGPIGILYAGWAIGQFYDRKKPASYLKGILAYGLGMVTFWMFPTLIGVVMDLLKNP